MEDAVHRSAPVEARAHLDKALSRAQRRMTDAARELARDRKLAVPALLANVNDKQLNGGALMTTTSSGT